jgi:hypothetical protein
MPGMDLTGEIWVETKANEGKSYFYNARTRETTWTKPEGPAVKIITQEQVLVSLEVSVAEYWRFAVFCDVMLLPLAHSLGPKITVMCRLTFRSTTDRIYDSSPIRV